MKTERRWLHSILTAASAPVPALPWERRPAAVPAPAVRPTGSLAAG